MIRNSGYQSLGEVGPQERESMSGTSYYSMHQHDKQPTRQYFDVVAGEDGDPQWYWRFIAQASSWMVLGGFLVLTSTFDIASDLRFSRGILYVIIAALLAGGYSLTLLLWFACTDLPFRRDCVFIPTASVSGFAFVATLYLVGSSTSYSTSEALFGVTLALSAVSTILYSVLAYSTSSRMRTNLRNETISRQQAFGAANGGASTYSGYTPTASASNTGTWMEPGYYRNFIANMHPTAYRGSSTEMGGPSSSSPIVRPGGNYQAVTEEDMVNQQMAGLLKQQNSRPAGDTSSTYRLEWPLGGLEDAADSPNARRNPGALPRVDERQSSKAAGKKPSAAMSKLGRALKVPGTIRGRNDGNGSSSDSREKSREQRQKEIELSNMA